ncbi:MAG: flagellar hook-associated protein FlgL [Deltaproteobacteria bacterium]|nr:flagellar hook-associated protein FlgL [Deltaproteobacteria bacterium]
MKSTQATTYRTLNSELNRLNGSLNTLRSQAATGKKLLNPSDDPAAIRPVLSARTDIRATDRFIESLATSLDRLQNQDAYLDQAENLLVSAKETAINAINGAMSDSDLETLADQISYIKTEMMSVANAQVGGQYIFAGFEEDTPPFVENGDVVSYQGDSNIKRLETSPGELVQTNLDGAKLFMGMSDTDGDGVLEKTGENIFDVLTNLERAIRGQSGEVLDAAGTVVSLDSGSFDTSGAPILYEYDGQPVNLQPMTNTDNQVMTIANYNNLPGVTPITDYDGLAVVDETQPVYLHSDGSIAVVDSGGHPVLSDSTTGLPILDNSVPPVAVSLMVAGDPIQYSEVPTLDELLSTLEKTADQSRSARGLMGNNAQRIETSREHLEGVLVDLQQILSRYEDADLIDVFTEITQTETALEAALKVTGQVSRLSILDYIK